MVKERNRCFCNPKIFSFAHKSQGVRKSPFIRFGQSIHYFSFNVGFVLNLHGLANPVLA